MTERTESADSNSIRSLSCSAPQLTVRAARDVRDLSVVERTIVLNAGMTPALIGGRPAKPLAPLSSTILQQTTVVRSDLALLLQVVDEGRVGELITRPDWELYGSLLARQIGQRAADEGGFPPMTPLFRSPQDSAGELAFDPRIVLGGSGGPQRSEVFQVRANLWFAPGGTDCAIHNQHDFIEIHTQVCGLGRMQKFWSRDSRTQYQDTVMSPGHTTEQPFCEMGEAGTFTYPWHQYHSDTDCVWLAVEYHRM